MDFPVSAAVAPVKSGAEILESLGITLRLRGGRGAPGKGASPGSARTHEGARHTPHRAQLFQG